MQMTNDEITVRYRQAKDKGKQDEKSRPLQAGLGYDGRDVNESYKNQGTYR